MWKLKMSEKCCKTPIKELCEQALKHYNEISNKACYYNSLIPKAIKYYEIVNKLDVELQTLKDDVKNDLKELKQTISFRAECVGKLAIINKVFELLGAK